MVIDGVWQKLNYTTGIGRLKIQNGIRKKGATPRSNCSLMYQATASKSQ
jgi:hypothetical protein